MADAVFRQGAPDSYVNYTPGSAVAAGEVLPFFGAAAAGGVAIAHLPIPAATPGAVAVGGGVYEVAGDAAIALGAVVYWNDATNQVTATSTGNKQFGYLVSACSGAGAICLAHHVKA